MAIRFISLMAPHQEPAEYVDPCGYVSMVAARLHLLNVARYELAERVPIDSHYVHSDSRHRRKRRLLRDRALA